jgi:geranylgeranyl diphosphate synthase type II
MAGTAAEAAPVARYPDDLRALIEDYLSGLRFSADPATAGLDEAMRYSLMAGGKRIRPVLALAAARAVGGRPEQVLPTAAAIELVHTYSLIHDDLPCMDDDDLRRGKPTSHKVFGEAVAVLAGDALLTRAFHVLAEVPPHGDPERLGRRLRAIAILGEAAGTTGLIGGQVEDIESEGRAIDEATLERLHRAKTGALLGACVRGGAVLGGAGEDDLARLGRYAAAVGLAFQVVDDILDATESAERLGKTAGKDDAAAKATYVRAHGVEGARRAAEQLLAQAESALHGLGPRADGLRELARMIVRRRG